MQTAYSIVEVPNPQPENESGACVVNGDGSPVRCFDSHPQALRLRESLNAQAWTAPAAVREVMAGVLAEIDAEEFTPYSHSVAWARRIAAGMPVTRRRAEQLSLAWAGAHAGGKPSLSDRGLRLLGGEPGKQWAHTLNGLLNDLGDVTEPIASSLIDVRYIPYDVRDSDGKYFSRETRIHLMDPNEDPYIPRPGVQEYHGLAFGGDTRTPGTVLRTWGDDTGRWATIELDPVHPYYDEYVGMSLNGTLYVSAGGSPTYFRIGENNHVTDWGTIEISLIRAKNGMQPKSWYAVAVNRDSRILNAAKPHTRIGKTRKALLNFLTALGFAQKSAENFVGSVEIELEDPAGTETEIEIDLSEQEGLDGGLGGDTRTDDAADASHVTAAGHPEIISEQVGEQIMTQENDALNARITALEASVAAAQEANAAATAQLAVLNSTNQALVTERDTLAAQTAANTSELEALRADLRARDEAAQVLNGRLQTVDAEAAALRATVQEAADTRWLEGLGSRIQHSERVAILARLKEARSADMVLNGVTAGSGKQEEALRASYESRSASGVIGADGLMIAGFQADAGAGGQATAEDTRVKILASTPAGRARLAQEDAAKSKAKATA